MRFSNFINTLNPSRLHQSLYEYELSRQNPVFLPNNPPPLPLKIQQTITSCHILGNTLIISGGLGLYVNYSFVSNIPYVGPAFSTIGTLGSLATIFTGSDLFQIAENLTKYPATITTPSVTTPSPTALEAGELTAFHYTLQKITQKTFILSTIAGIYRVTS